MRGFNEQGTTTTPFDMVVLNGMSRFHLRIEALRHARAAARRGSALIAECERQIAAAVRYTRDHLEDRAGDPRLGVDGRVDPARPSL